ncbi:MAG TPA: hypothetical protein VHP32_06740 [Ignavibacteria bacterium]|nr:hypothetical protein [Ignavibacteria bacterium]
MNKYSVSIPYDYRKYGDKTGFVYAEDEEEAEELASEGYLEDEEYEDSDNSDDTNYYYDEMSVSLEEEDIPDDLIPERNTYNESHSFTVSNSLAVNSSFLEDLPAVHAAA